MLTLTPREGVAPRVFGPAPHGQGSQISPIMLQEELWERMRALPYVYMAPTLVSVPHARALFLPEGIGTGPAEAFQGAGSGATSIPTTTARSTSRSRRRPRPTSSPRAGAYTTPSRT